MKKIFSLFVSFCLILTFSGCSIERASEKYYQGDFMAIDYTLKNANSKDSEIIANHVKEIIDSVESEVSLDNPQSDIVKINQSKGEWVEVSSIVSDMLTISMEIYNSTDGAFNPAMYPLVKLWGFTPDNEGKYTETREIPSEEDVQKALLYTDFSKLEIDGNKVRKLDVEMEIDLGGIAKGYAVDMVQKAYLNSTSKAQEGLIGLMSNILAIGSKKGDTAYTIAVTNPRVDDTNDGYFAVVELADVGISTSGDYEKYFVFEDKRYSHIIGKNGYPIDDVIAVTVFSYSSGFADAMSTALCVMGMDKAVEYANENNIDCIIINSDLQYKIIGNVTIKEGMEINKAYREYE